MGHLELACVDGVKHGASEVSLRVGVSLVALGDIKACCGIRG